MNSMAFEGWLVAGFAMHLAGAIGCALALVWFWQRGDRERPERTTVLGALGITATWCVIAAAFGAASPVTSLVESARNLAWLLVVYRLFANDGRHRDQDTDRCARVTEALCDTCTNCLSGCLTRIVHVKSMDDQIAILRRIGGT